MSELPLPSVRTTTLILFSRRRFCSYPMRLLASFVIPITVAVTSPLNSQQPSVARLDLTIGASTVRGGSIDFRNGVLADALAAGRLRPTSGGALVAGLGA